MSRSIRSLREKWGTTTDVFGEVSTQDVIDFFAMNDDDRLVADVTDEDWDGDQTTRLIWYDGAAFLKALAALDPEDAALQHLSKTGRLGKERAGDDPEESELGPALLRGLTDTLTEMQLCVPRWRREKDDGQFKLLLDHY